MVAKLSEEWGPLLYEVPEQVLEDTDVLREWALKAREAAIESKNK